MVRVKDGLKRSKPRGTDRRALFLIFVVALACLSTLQSFAQGGPPFRTDDPDTPGNGHWEINFGFIGDRNPGNGAYQVPDFDINYGLGDRIQLKYEIPIALEETRPQPATADAPSVDGTIIGGLGASLLGIKWRFYEHHPGDASISSGFGTGLLALFHQHSKRTQPPDNVKISSEPPSFELGTYPQLNLNNPTDSVQRGLVASGPNFYLPVEVSGRIGPIRYNADAGYNFGNSELPQRWNRGLILGHEFSDRTEAYCELYDEQDANRIPAGRGVGNFSTGTVKQREATLGLGGRQALNHAKTLNLLLMGGRSFQTPSAETGQPSWIAYVGLQVLLGPKVARASEILAPGIGTAHGRVFRH
jgi:hypothetical protein